MLQKVCMHEDWNPGSFAPETGVRKWSCDINLSLYTASILTTFLHMVETRVRMLIARLACPIVLQCIPASHEVRHTSFRSFQAISGSSLRMKKKQTFVVRDKVIILLE